MGKPKGVLMKQEALCNLIAWQIKDSTMSANSRTLQFSPLTFDVSFQEIFCTLSIGGTLCLIDDELRLDASALLDFIAAHQINRLFLPFVALQALCDLGVAAVSFHKVCKR
jgi:non-ribosomal peptide synthetase component F